MGKKIHLTFSGSWKASGPGELEVAHLCFLWIRVSEGKHFFSWRKMANRAQSPCRRRKILPDGFVLRSIGKLFSALTFRFPAEPSGSTEPAVKSPVWFTATTAAISVSSRKTANCRERLRFSISRSSLLRSIFPRRQTGHSPMTWRTMGRAAGPIRENSRIFLNSRKNSCTRTASGSTLHRGRKPAWFSGKGSRGLSPKRKSQPAGNRSTGSICCMPPRGAEKRKKLSAVLKSSIPTAAARPFRSATPWM